MAHAARWINFCFSQGWNITRLASILQSAATQKGAIINKPCGVMASIYRHRSQMPRLNGSSGAAAAHKRSPVNWCTQYYTDWGACLRSRQLHKAAKRALSIKRWLYHIKSALAVDTAHSAHSVCAYVLRCGNMQNQCAAPTSTSVLTVRCKCIWSVITPINLLIAAKTRIVTWLLSYGAWWKLLIKQISCQSNNIYYTGDTLIFWPDNFCKELFHQRAYIGLIQAD